MIDLPQSELLPVELVPHLVCSIQIEFQPSSIRIVGKSRLDVASTCYTSNKSGLVETEQSDPEKPFGCDPSAEKEQKQRGD